MIDTCCGEIRSGEGFSFLDLRYVVDSAKYLAWFYESGEKYSPAGAYC